MFELKFINEHNFTRLKLDHYSTFLKQEFSSYLPIFIMFNLNKK